MEHASSFVLASRTHGAASTSTAAMVGVGLWVGLNGGRALWARPVAFVGATVGERSGRGRRTAADGAGILHRSSCWGCCRRRRRGPSGARALLPCSPSCTAMRMAPSFPPKALPRGLISLWSSRLAMAALHALGLGARTLPLASVGNSSCRCGAWSRSLAWSWPC